ncbi:MULTISPECIES: HTTM domain-containing protein [Streptomyces]|uniref:HTTM domain-containing protein n=1 Tax=Streptomyces sudanensis TaxID=436397 RepID=A0ABY4TEF6_9ACTN|nr:MULTISPECIES: HTTM domain-containing protein [Streptomyces]MCP9958247.1 HTTM domain-containing protein [Streptomyces sudanensis]MCP9987373.1 HTTM domain-containing protein [Streptomyces sudanensis]MCQ0001230.1 HTTM domain-containing protein [Streptomyces sudanensis]URN16826.1 HTTM domain-containing protein [Streptomyces sudanensis]
MNPSSAPRHADRRESPDQRLARAVQRLTGTALGPYQSAVVRIGFAATWLVFLLREFPHRHELYGPQGPWGWHMARQLIADNHSFTVLVWTDSVLWFEAVYAGAVLSSALLMVGWRTRATSALFMVGVLSLQNRSVFMGDGGDNVIHLMAIYLVLTRCGRVWSLDARRRSRRPAGAGTDPAGVVLWSVLGFGLVAVLLFHDRSGEPWIVALLWLLWLAQGAWWLVCRIAPGQPRVLLDVLANLLHNATLAVIMAEVCLIYATAGWYKIQGSRWQDGTALYYPLKLDYFSPWPALSGLLAGASLVVMIITYGTVIVQVAFPFTLFNRRVKNVLLAVMMMEHAGIAVLLGLPAFSLAMITADAVFLPTVFLLWLEGRVRRAGRRLRPGRATGREGRDPVPDAPAPRTLVG